MLYDQLQPGDFIRVTFGKGSQAACIAKRSAKGILYAWKLSARTPGGGRWRGPIRIYPSEVMNRIAASDTAKFPKVPA